jgi:hypothetical protein
MQHSDLIRRAARCAERARAAAGRAAEAREQARQACSRAAELRVLTDECLRKRDWSAPARLVAPGWDGRGA